jgi:hypothetical protein
MSQRSGHHLSRVDLSIGKPITNVRVEDLTLRFRNHYGLPLKAWHSHFRDDLIAAPLKQSTSPSSLKQ